MIYTNNFNPNPPTIKCDNSLDLSRFIRHRTVGLFGNPSCRQSSIIGHLNKNRNFIEERKYKFKKARKYDLSSVMLDVDFSGQNILIGGTSADRCSVRLANLGSRGHKFHEIITGGYVMRSLQWRPSGDDHFKVNLLDRIRIFDAKRRKLIYDLRRPGGTLSSDWHPSDVNLIALTGRRGFELVDLRDRARSSAIRDSSTLGVACYWSRRNSNQLMLSDMDNTVRQYDIRNKSSIGVGDFGMGQYIRSIKMNPKGTFLFTWSLEEHAVHMCHCDESQTWENAKYLNRFDFLPWETKSRDYDMDYYQFHVSDTHLFMPIKSDDWRPNEESNVAIKVIDIYTGEVSNEIKAISDGYDPILEGQAYRRIDAVTAPSNHWDTERIYTLNDKQQIGIYTLSGGSQGEVSRRYKKLTKSKSRRKIIQQPRR